MIAFFGVVIGLAFAVGGVVAAVLAVSEKAPLAWLAAIALFALCPAMIYGGLFYGPQYDVWQQGMAGKAELTRAEQNRQIRTEEARANLEAARLNAQSEIENAKGAAEANKIMAESLGGPDRYLRWRWITMLETSKGSINREIIYVPSDGEMPMSEAGRAVQR